MTPIVVALTGLPGTGKTSLADALYPLLPDYAFVDVDTLTIPLVQTALKLRGVTMDEASASGELRQLRDAQYECLFSQTRQLVGFGRKVLMVGSMSSELADPPRFHEVAASFAPARLLLVRTHAPGTVVSGRIEQRAGYWDRLRLERWKLDGPRYDNPAPLPMPGLEVNTTAGTPAQLARDVVEWIRATEPRRDWEAQPANGTWQDPRVSGAGDLRRTGSAWNGIGVHR